MPSTYLMIGGSHGIGLALARKWSAAGHYVLACARTAGELSELPGVEYRPLDILADTLTPEQLPDVLQGLVYCPGSINLRPFNGLKPEHFREELEINLIGAVKAIQAALKALKNSPGSGIVLFSTVAVGTGMPYHASIAAAKGAIEGLARSLAAELAPQVRVNCIAPSLTDTPLAARLLNTPEKQEAAAARHPLKRFGTAAEIAALADFLLSPEAGWMTGQILHADGGMSAVRV